MNKRFERNKGFSHHFILPIIVMITVGAIGLYTLTHSRAAILAEDSYFPSDSSYITDGESYVLNEPIKDSAAYTAPIISTGVSTSITVATWNVLKYDNSVSHMRKGIKDIFAAGASVIGLQEVSKPSFTKNSPASAVKRMNIGVYSPGEGTAIVWDKNKVEKVSADSFRPILRKERRFTYVRFRDRSSSQQFYVLNLHMQPGVNAKPENCKTKECTYYKAQMKSLASKIKQLQKKKLPIMIVGDFNIDYQLDTACKISWYPCNALSKVSMMSSYQALTLETTDGSAKKYLDHAYFWTSNEEQTVPVSNKILGTDSVCKKSNKHDSDGDTIVHCWNNSDHKPLLFTAKLGKS